MKLKKVETVKDLIENDHKIDYYWIDSANDYCFDVIDVINNIVNCENINVNEYWGKVKVELDKKNININKNIYYFDDIDSIKIEVIDIIGVFKLILYIGNKNVDKFKLWLAWLGYKKIYEIFNPDIMIDDAVNYYLGNGFDYNKINKKISLLTDSNKLFSKFLNKYESSNNIHYDLLDDMIKYSNSL